jgi:hypothetical protein
MAGKTHINDPEAEVIALKALAYLASDEDRIRRFLDLTGVTPAELRARAGERGFLGSVLEYLGTDQTLLLAFTESEGLEPELIGMACLRLTGQPL